MKRPIIVATVLLTLLIAGCYLAGLSRSTAGNRVSPNPSVARSSTGDTVLVVNNKARYWQNTTLVGDFDIRTISGCQAAVAATLGAGATIDSGDTTSGTKYQVEYDPDSFAWYFLATAKDTTSTQGGFCLAVSRTGGASFPTSQRWCSVTHAACTGAPSDCSNGADGTCDVAWQPFVFAIPDASYCTSTSCDTNDTAHSYLSRAQMGLDSHILTVTGIRATAHRPTGAASSFACDTESYIFAASLDDLGSVSDSANVYHEEFVPTTPTGKGSCLSVVTASSNRVPRALTPVRNRTGQGFGVLVGVRDDGVSGHCASDPDRICINTNQCGGGTCAAATNTGSLQVSFITPYGNCSPHCYGREDIVLPLPTGTAINWTQPEGGGCGFGIQQKGTTGVHGQIDPRGILGSRPHFDNGYLQGERFWTAATVGSSIWNGVGTPTGSVGTNALVVGVDLVACGGGGPTCPPNNVTGVVPQLASTILMTSGGTSVDGVFAPSVFVDTLGDVVLGAYRVGPSFDLRAVMAFRHATDPPNTLRNWTEIGNLAAKAFQPSDQPAPFFFGRTTGQTSDPMGTNTTNIFAYEAVGNDVNSTCTGPGTCTGCSSPTCNDGNRCCGCCNGAGTGTCNEWTTQLDTYMESDLPQ